MTKVFQVTGPGGVRARYNLRQLVKLLSTLRIGDRIQVDREQ